MDMSGYAQILYAAKQIIVLACCVVLIWESISDLWFRSIPNAAVLSIALLGVTYHVVDELSLHELVGARRTVQELLFSLVLSSCMRPLIRIVILGGILMLCFAVFGLLKAFSQPDSSLRPFWCIGIGGGDIKLFGALACWFDLLSLCMLVSVSCLLLLISGAVKTICYALGWHKVARNPNSKGAVDQSLDQLGRPSDQQMSKRSVQPSTSISDQALDQLSGQPLLHYFLAQKLPMGPCIALAAIGVFLAGSGL